MGGKASLGNEFGLYMCGLVAHMSMFLGRVVLKMDRLDTQEEKRTKGRTLGTHLH